MAAAELTFVGTATVLLRLGAFTILTDPNFLHRGQRAYLGRGLWTRRLTDPSMAPDELPHLDAIVLSHLHGDHFDRVARRELSRDAPVVTTPHAAHRLERYRFTTVGLRTWEAHTLSRGNEQLLITSTPGVHAYGMLGRLLPPVMGSLIEHRVDGELRHRLHISGDTLTGPHVDDIAERFPSVGTAIVHLGGTRVLWHTVTMDGPQGVDFLRRLHADVAVPVHYDDYRAFRSPLRDFVAAAQHGNLDAAIKVVRRGETLTLDTHVDGRDDSR
jgi:L-ascorbate metabolism protein UlaG (beta-lactamase superfamily)